MLSTSLHDLYYLSTHVATSSITTSHHMSVLVVSDHLPFLASYDRGRWEREAPPISDAKGPQEIE